MPFSADPYNLQRFLDAQEPVYDKVLAELRVGRKRTHWIWFIFPQITGLGASPTAEHYAIHSLGEARAYLAHSILGFRLRECTELVLKIEGKGIDFILCPPDHLKFRSSMTLFSKATDDNQLFLSALQRYFAGQPDPLTTTCLRNLGNMSQQVSPLRWTA
jgi:uncharacterized protein (DUF1810 family)